MPETKGLVIIVCGSRDWTDVVCIRRELRALHRTQGIRRLIEGGARGADSIANRVALPMNLPEGVLTIHPTWEKYGKAAGPMRNRAMLGYKPDLVLAFHEDLEHSKGTKDMVAQARKAGVEVRVITGREE